MHVLDFSSRSGAARKIDSVKPTTATHSWLLAARHQDINMMAIETNTHPALAMLTPCYVAERDLHRPAFTYSHQGK